MSVSRRPTSSRSRSNESHSSRLLAATDIGAVLSAMSRASSIAAGSTSSASSTRLPSPSATARCPSNVAPVSRISAALDEADQPREHPVRVRVADDAAPDLHDAVLRVGGEQPDVALQRQRQAQPDRVPVDRGDHRLGQRPRRHVDARRAESRPWLGEGAIARAEVGTGAERRRGAGQHHDTDRVVPVAAPVGVGQLLAHAVADGVALLRPVQRDGCHTTVDGSLQRSVSGQVGAAGHAAYLRSVRSDGSLAMLPHWAPPYRSLGPFVLAAVWSVLL